MFKNYLLPIHSSYFCKLYSSLKWGLLIKLVTNISSSRRSSERIMCDMVIELCVEFNAFFQCLKISPMFSRRKVRYTLQFHDICSHMIWNFIIEWNFSSRFMLRTMLVFVFRNGAIMEIHSILNERNLGNHKI